MSKHILQHCSLCSSVLHILMITKIFLNLHLAKFLNVLAKSFFLCIKEKSIIKVIKKNKTKI